MSCFEPELYHSELGVTVPQTKCNAYLRVGVIVDRSCEVGGNWLLY